ncbi:MAG: hypothetical protein Q4C63_01810 [Eubacteriales bacterium]|nr:hypothetical protein [Eubacteriales bacterium]
MNDRHHFDRHKKRHLIDRLLMLVIAFSGFLLAGTAYYRYAVYSQSIMSEAVSESDYYDRQYQQFEQELNLFLGAIGVPEDVVSKNQELRDWYSFELRKKVLTEDQAGAFENGIREKIEVPVRNWLNENNIQLSKEAELGFAGMLSSLETNLTEELNHPDIRRWYTEKASFEAEYKKSVLLSAAAFTVSGILLFLIQHFQYRAFHYMGSGVILGGLMSTAYVIYMHLGFGTEATEETPGALSLYADKVLAAGILISLLMVGTGVFLLITERIIRRYRTA